MSDPFIDGPMPSGYSANDDIAFAIGQGEQCVPVTEEGYLVANGS